MYKLPNLNLRYAASDAVNFGKLLVSKGATVYSLVNGTRKQMLETIEQSEGKDVENSLLIFYYAGQAISDASGRSWLLPTDFKSDVLDPEALSQTAISGALVHDILSRARSQSTILFFDTSASSQLLSTR